jgi:cytochrome c-type biogenesis protein CcmH/NrfG
MQHSSCTVPLSVSTQNALFSNFTKSKKKLVLGKVYEQWNKPEEAIEAYRQALKATPDSKPARQSVERLERK